MSVKVFFCYAHEDEPLLKRLKQYLTPMQRQGSLRFGMTVILAQELNGNKKLVSNSILLRLFCYLSVQILWHLTIVLVLR